MFLPCEPIAPRFCFFLFKISPLTKLQNPNAILLCINTRALCYELNQFVYSSIIFVSAAKVQPRIGYSSSVKRRFGLRWLVDFLIFERNSLHSTLYMISCSLITIEMGLVYCCIDKPKCHFGKIDSEPVEMHKTQCICG